MKLGLNLGYWGAGGNELDPGLRYRVGPVLGTLVGALSVHDHRGGHDQPANAITSRDHGLEQGGGADRVRLAGAAHIHERLAVAHDAAKMEDALDARERARDRVGIAQVAGDQLRRGIELAVAAHVRKHIEVVEDPYSMAIFDQCAHEVGPDEAGSAGHEVVSHGSHDRPACLRNHERRAAGSYFRNHGGLPSPACPTSYCQSLMKRKPCLGCSSDCPLATGRS